MKASEEVHGRKLPVVLLITKTDILGERLNMMRQNYEPRGAYEDSSLSDDSEREEKMIRTWRGSQRGTER